MNPEPVTLLYWIIPMLSGILCGVIGYLWGRGPMGPSALRNEAESLKASNEKLRAELDSCMDRLASARTQGISHALPFNAREAREALGKSVRQDDLTLIEGIGPKIVGLFQNFDIHTWKELSEASVAKCQEVLDSGGERYKLHDPSSWPMQARMAYEGKWKELAKWQREHLHGKL
jgi:predicted flap endonuclease-1-like 5' DNA nuclease